jgi:hypothetical protein
MFQVNQKKVIGDKSINLINTPLKLPLEQKARTLELLALRQFQIFNLASIISTVFLIKYLRRGVKSGTVGGELVDFPKGSREFSLLHSTDGGVTKLNGTSTSGKRFIIDLGVMEQRVQVSGYFLGTFQRKSEECDAMDVFVL